MKTVNIKRNAEAVDQLRGILNSNFDKATSGRDEKATRFRHSYLYYTCQAPAKSAMENSGYIEPVVRKAVEAVKPSLMNIFTENEKKAVTLRPSVLVPKPLADMVDDMINKLFLQENEGYDLIERCITEAMVSGDVFVKYFVEDNITEEERTFEKATPEEVSPLIIEFPDTDWSEMKEDKKGLLSGTVTLTRKESPIKVEFVPFSELFITGATEDIRKSRYLCHRITKTVGELVEAGYDFKELQNAATATDDNYLSTADLVNDGCFVAKTSEDYNMDPAEREVYLYEHYTYSSLFNKKGVSKLYRVMATDSAVLSVEEAKCIPFVHGVIERIPGSFWGVSFYDKFGPAQDFLSHAVRTMEQNAYLGTYGRYMVVKGAYDRQSLLNSHRPGAVVEVEQAGAISSFDAPMLPPTLTTTIDRVTALYKEDTVSAVGVDVTGGNMSATAAAITANSADLKDKVIARVLSYTLFKPLFEGLYNIIRDEDLTIGQMPGPIDPMTGQPGAQVDITGSSLPKVSEFVVDVNTVNDDAVLANQLIQLGNTFAQWAQAQQPLLNAQTMVGIAKRITGLDDQGISEFFTVPQPSEEEMVMQQEQMAEQKELSELNKEMLRAQVGTAGALAAKTEQETVEMIKDGSARRKRDEEKSVVNFEEVGIKKRKQDLEEVIAGVDLTK